MFALQRLSAAVFVTAVAALSLNVKGESDMATLTILSGRLTMTHCASASRKKSSASQSRRNSGSFSRNICRNVRRSGRFP